MGGMVHAPDEQPQQWVGWYAQDDQPQQWVGWYATHDQPQWQNLVPTR